MGHPDLGFMDSPRVTIDLRGEELEAVIDQVAKGGVGYRWYLRDLHALARELDDHCTSLERQLGEERAANTTSCRI